MSDYKGKKMIAIAETMKAYASGDRPWSVAYSGGKDSTVALDIVIRSLLHLKKFNPDAMKRKVYIITAQTHLDFVTDPLKQEEMDKIRRLIEEKDLPMEIREVSAPLDQTFMFLVLGKGYPLPKSKVNRWCTDRGKLQPPKQELKEIQPEVTVLGVRLSESAERRNSIENHRSSEFYGDGTFMPIVNFTLDDVWSYLVLEGMAWGSADKLGQLYKEATGECGLRQKKAGSGEKNDDPCGARTGCIICPVVTIDKSSQEFAKSHPELQPYVELRNVIIDMYKNPLNKAGRKRDGTVLEYGQGTFTVKARLKLYALVKQAEEDHKYLCEKLGVKPQLLIYSGELDYLIQQQWETDLRECPWVEDAAEVGRYYESKIKGLTSGYQLVWNHLYDTTGGAV